MAARSMQAVSQALRRVVASNFFSASRASERHCNLVCEGSHFLSGGFGTPPSGALLPVSRSASCVSLMQSRVLDSLLRPRAQCGNARLGFTSFSTLVVDASDTQHGNALEIGYRVVGQYVPDAGKIKPQAAFAVVQVGSHQFKVSPGDMIYTEKLKHADINDELCLNKVLLLGSLTQTIIGRPVIPEASVIATVEEHALDAKVIIFKKKRRKNYRRTKGHRQELTRLRILRIQGVDDSIPGALDIQA